MSEAPDAIAGLRAFLLADPDVAALVSGRVFGGELAGAEAASMPRKAIVVARAGGPGAIGKGYQRYGDIGVELRCYGETPHSADQLWRRAYPALKQLARVIEDGCLIHWAKLGGGPMALRDPDTDWPFTLASFQVLVAEVAAA